MPLYDFRCMRCDHVFEASAPTPCPECGGAQVRRLYVPFAGPFTVAPRGLAARRSDAERRAREEQRRERRENRELPENRERRGSA